MTPKRASTGADRMERQRSAWRLPSGLVVATAVVVWSVGTVGMWLFAARYESTPGRAGAAQAWPASVPFSPASSGLTLVFFVHPQCPCTRASLSELKELLAARDDVTTYVVWRTLPDELLDDRGRGLLADADRIRHSEIIPDPDGALSLKFGAETSGQVGVFNARGEILYWGGTTKARGVRGANSNSDLLKTVLDTGRPVAARAVFGCPIQDPGGGTP